MGLAPEMDRPRFQMTLYLTAGTAQQSQILVSGASALKYLLGTLETVKTLSSSAFRVLAVQVAHS